MSGPKPVSTFVRLVLVAAALSACRDYPPRDWSSYDVLSDAPPGPTNVVGGQEIPEHELIDWVRWGEEWFRNETFGNERVWTDVIGFLQAEVEFTDGEGGTIREPVFPYVLRAIDALDDSVGNLYAGNGGAYTHDLILRFPQGTRLADAFDVPEMLHTGLDVEASGTLPLGVVAVEVAPEDRSLPYLYDPARYAEGPSGLGPAPDGGPYRLGLTCALCHYSLDVDWDGEADLVSLRYDEPTPGSPYRPWHGWAVGNQDIHLGWIFAFTGNPIAGFENSGPVGDTTLADARGWADMVKSNYRSNPDTVAREVIRGLLAFPRGYADDTPDGLHNPLQFPSLHTAGNWPFNYDGVMLNASDRNNNVWTTGLDPTQLVALTDDRGGRTAKLAFWNEQGMYSRLTAAEYADILLERAPAVLHDPSSREMWLEDILGTSDGVPGLLDNESTVVIDGVPGALPDEVRDHPENEARGRLREPADFGDDGEARGPMVGLLGTRVATPPDVRRGYGVDDIARRYGLNPDEFLTDAVSLMLDWVDPPPNLSSMSADARADGLVERGYEVFKEEGCAACHTGPYFTNNMLVDKQEIGTDRARVDATAPLQQFLAPRYDPATGEAVKGGIGGFLANFFSGRKPGYKVVMLRYLWGSAPYLHDGGVGIAVAPETSEPPADLAALLALPEDRKLYGMGPILASREADPSSYLRPDAALSLQAVLLESERERVIAANRRRNYPVPGFGLIPMHDLHIRGIGHEYWIDDRPGGERVTAVVAFLLALDDDPRR